MNQTTIPTAPEIAIEDIHVKEGFNPRTKFDPETITAMAETMASDGVIEPLVLHFDESGIAWLVAGGRRLLAAREAGLRTVPYSVYQGDNPLRAALIENVHREDLDPIDEARGMKALIDQGEMSKKRLAEEMRRSLPWVGSRLRLLDLPEGVQELIAEGAVSPDAEAERVLRKVAEVSPRIAECVCITAKRRKVAPSSFVAEFGNLLTLTSAGRFEHPPTMIAARQGRISDFVGDPEERKELTERSLAVYPHAGTDPYVSMSVEAIDAARAAGCLLEHKTKEGEFTSSVAFFTDAAFATDLVRRAVDEQESLAAKRTEQEAAWRERTGQTTPGTPEEQKAERATKRQAAKEASSRAADFNQSLGLALLERRGKGTRRQHGLARAQAIATVLLADNPELPGRGLRLVLPQLREVEVRTLKSGEPREKTEYAEKDQCLAYFRNRIEEAKSADVVLELLADALIAGLLADQDALPQSRRVGWWNHGEEGVAKLLADDIKSVKPRRSRRK